jgi:hypothetical protein
VGIQLDLDEGTVRFIKNDRDLGLGFLQLHKHPAVTGGPGYEAPALRGLRPCAFLGGPSDKVMLLGLKSGPGRRVFEKQDSFQRREFVGQWRYGMRHGPGTLRYQTFPGFWRGLWWGGMQHGVQLWVSLDEQGREAKATPFLFERDVQIRELQPSEAQRVLQDWEAEVKARQPPPEEKKDEEAKTPATPQQDSGAGIPADAPPASSTQSTPTSASIATPTTVEAGTSTAAPAVTTQATSTSLGSSSSSSSTSTGMGSSSHVSVGVGEGTGLRTPPTTRAPSAFTFSSPLSTQGRGLGSSLGGLGFGFGAPPSLSSGGGGGLGMLGGPLSDDDMAAFTASVAANASLEAERRGSLLHTGGETRDPTRVKEMVATSRALLVVRIIYEAGATVRNGIEIDMADQVRRHLCFANQSRQPVPKAWDGL